MMRCCACVFLLCLFSVPALAQGKLVLLNGAQLYVHQLGAGDPVIVIHGGPGLNHNYFRPFLDPLSKSFALVYYDQRACGQSLIPSPDSLTLSFFIHDIDALRKHLKAERINLLAHSWGALLAVHYALEYPDHVRKIVLSNPAPLSKEYDQEMNAFIRSHITPEDSLTRAGILKKGKFTPADYEELFKINFRASAYSKKKVDGIDFSIPDNFSDAQRALFTGLSTDLTNYNWYDRLHRIEVPVLIIHGQADGIPRTAIDRLHAALPASTLLLFDKSGHFPFVEEPKRYVKEVSDFLSSGKDRK